MPEAVRANGFPPSLRLRQAAEFKRVFEHPRPHKSVDRCFTVLAVPNNLEHARLGLVVARKRIRRAVARNRVKRLSRESFRQASLPALDIVVLPRDQAAVADNPQLFRSLAGHWQRLARLCAKSSSA